MLPDRRAGAPDIEITLRRMRFHSFVGILPHEREVAQPIEVDLTVWVEAAEGIVDYAKLYREVASVLNAGAIDFLEQVGDRVLDGAFAVSPRVRRARVVVRKPRVPLDGPLDYAEIVMRRSRDGDTPSSAE